MILKAKIKNLTKIQSLMKTETHASGSTSGQHIQLPRCHILVRYKELPCCQSWRGYGVHFVQVVGIKTTE